MSLVYSVLFEFFEPQMAGCSRRQFHRSLLMSEFLVYSPADCLCFANNSDILAEYGPSLTHRSRRLLTFCWPVVYQLLSDSD